MITFETRFDEHTGLWQWRTPKGHWSKPEKLGKVAEALRGQVADAPAPVNSKRFNEQWSKPLEPTTRHGKAFLAHEEEIRKRIAEGNYQRIPADVAERQAQQVDELTALLGLED